MARSRARGGLIKPRFVKAFVKGSKNDALDAEAIFEAADLNPTYWQFWLGVLLILLVFFARVPRSIRVPRT